MMKTVIIVQARMTSTRLHGKVLRKVLDRPLLDYLIERLKRVRSADDVVIATTINNTDLPIVELCEKLNCRYYRGSEDDVLGRYYYAATEFGADAVVRVTSDCPLIDPNVIDDAIQYYQENSAKYDYVSNILKRSYPRGMDCEVFSYDVLERAFHEATASYEREHVTPFINRHPDRHRLGCVMLDEDQSHHRWTVDTPEDFELIGRMIETLYPKIPEFTLKDCLELIKRNPEWERINAHIEQKQI